MTSVVTAEPKKRADYFSIVFCQNELRLKPAVTGLNVTQMSDDKISHFHFHFDRPILKTNNQMTTQFWILLSTILPEYQTPFVPSTITIFVFSGESHNNILWRMNARCSRVYSYTFNSSYDVHYSIILQSLLRRTLSKVLSQKNIPFNLWIGLNYSCIWYFNV